MYICVWDPHPQPQCMCVVCMRVCARACVYVKTGVDVGMLLQQWWNLGWVCSLACISMNKTAFSLVKISVCLDASRLWSVCGDITCRLFEMPVQGLGIHCVVCLHLAGVKHNCTIVSRVFSLRLPCCYTCHCAPHQNPCENSGVCNLAECNA